MLSIEGIIVNMEGQKRGRIEISTKSGLITKVSEPTGKADFIFNDELIFPGFIDLHVHAREDISHSQDYKEDFKTAGEAAVNGGVVAFADMPNNKIPPVDEKSYEEKIMLAKKCEVPVLLYAGIGPDNKPLSRKVPYKIFMGKSVGDLFFTSEESLGTALEKYKGQNISFHCEDPKILEEYSGAKDHESRRPKEAEISAIDFALKIIERYSIQGKICHVSTAEGIKKIAEAKKRGLSVTVEVTPHHLYFDETMIEKNRKIFQVNPPIRKTKENRLELIEALRNGQIDYLATDHAPHSIEEKEKGISGFPNLDTYGSFTTWLIKEHNFSPKDIVRVCAKNPAIFLNQFLVDKYGEGKEGYVGSLTVIDLNKSTTITKNKLKTKCKWSPFDGVIFPGEVVMTIIKGKVYEK